MKAHFCPVCGAKAWMPFSKQSVTIEHEGLTATVTDLSGQRCSDCGEMLFNAASAARYAAAGDALVLQARANTRADIRRIRRKLGLSQAKAAKLTGGGHNAFSRYERGETQPMPAVINLFRLLDKHPELLKELD